MFGEFNGLPVHALVIHAAVIFTPIAALLGFGLLIPRWRMLLRWPLVASASLAFVSVWVSTISGKVLKKALGDQLNGNVTGDLVARHQQLGQRLWLVLMIYLAVAVILALLLPRLANPHAGLAFALIVAVLAVVVIVLVIQTGDAGAKARWNPDGSFDYSGS